LERKGDAMNTGMLWFDNTKKTPLSAKIAAAVAYYRRKYFGIELNMEYIALSRERTTTDVMLPMMAKVVTV